jgi:hypothetical protein
MRLVSGEFESSGSNYRDANGLLDAKRILHTSRASIHHELDEEMRREGRCLARCSRFS